MFRRFVLAAILLAGLALPAAAQRAGAYAVEGRGPDNQTYTGSVTLAPTGPETWRLTWRIGGETINGVGIAVPGGLVVAYFQDRQVGAAFYVAQPDGILEGRWTWGRDGGVGIERLLPR